MKTSKKLNFKKLFYRNWKLKIFSIFIATILFIYVYQSKYEVKTLEIQLEMVELPSDLLLVRKPDPYLNVTFRGATENLEFDTSNLRIVLENPAPKPGMNIYRAKLVPDPPSKIDASFKEEQKVLLDKKITRTLPIVSNLKLEKSEDFVLGYVRLQPRFITLTGPYETLAKIEKIKTTLQSIEAEKEFIYTQHVLIEELPDFVKPIDNQAIEVEINVHILAKERLKEFDNIHTKKVRCLNKLDGIKTNIIGQKDIRLYLEENIDIKNRTDKLQIQQLKAYTYCPVFFDEETKQLMPSFTLSQPVFILDSEGNESINVLTLEPENVELQFEINKEKISP